LAEPSPGVFRCPDADGRSAHYPAAIALQIRTWSKSRCPPPEWAIAAKILSGELEAGEYFFELRLDCRWWAASDGSVRSLDCKVVGRLRRADASLHQNLRETNIPFQRARRRAAIKLSWSCSGMARRHIKFSAALNDFWIKDPWEQRLNRAAAHSQIIPITRRPSAGGSSRSCKGIAAGLAPPAHVRIKASAPDRRSPATAHPPARGLRRTSSANVIFLPAGDVFCNGCSSHGFCSPKCCWNDRATKPCGRGTKLFFKMAGSK